MKSKRFLISNIISKKNKINIQNNNNSSNVTIFNNNNFVINDKDIEEDNISTINPLVSMFAMSSFDSKKINENNNINKSLINLNSNIYLDICDNNNINFNLKNKIPHPKKIHNVNKNNLIINNEEEYNKTFINNKINKINLQNKTIEDDCCLKKELYFNLLKKLKNLKNNISSNVKNYSNFLKNKQDKMIKKNLNNDKLQDYLKIKNQKIIKNYIFLFFNIVKNQIKLKNTLIYLRNKRNKKNVFNFLKKNKKIEKFIKMIKRKKYFKYSLMIMNILNINKTLNLNHKKYVRNILLKNNFIFIKNFIKKKLLIINTKFIPIFSIKLFFKKSNLNNLNKYKLYILKQKFYYKKFQIKIKYKKINKYLYYKNQIKIQCYKGKNIIQKFKNLKKIKKHKIIYNNNIYLKNKKYFYKFFLKKCFIKTYKKHLNNLMINKIYFYKNKINKSYIYKIFFQLIYQKILIKKIKTINKLIQNNYLILENNYNILQNFYLKFNEIKNIFDSSKNYLNNLINKYNDLNNENKELKNKKLNSKNEFNNLIEQNLNDINSFKNVMDNNIKQLIELEKSNKICSNNILNELNLKNQKNDKNQIFQPSEKFFSKLHIK